MDALHALRPPTERFRAVVEEKPALGQFFSYLRPFRRFLLEIALAALTTQLLNLLLPVFTKFVIDQVIAKQDRGGCWPALAAMAAMTALSRAGRLLPAAAADLRAA